MNEHVMLLTMGGNQDGARHTTHNGGNQDGQATSLTMEEMQQGTSILHRLLWRRCNKGQAYYIAHYEGDATRTSILHRSLWRRYDDGLSTLLLLDWTEHIAPDGMD